MNSKIKFHIVLFVLLTTTIRMTAQCGTVISTFPYNEGFEAGPAWTSGGTNSDWAWGSPSHPTISSAGGGTKCWTTGGLSGSFYNYSESSWLMSPCFDFSILNYPWISFKMFWEDEYKYDGMTFQYSLNGGTTWFNVGTYGDPVNCLNANWHNYNNITWLTSTPKSGWTGRSGATSGGCQGGNGSNGWVTAKHCMATLAGKPSVRFRFLFGSGTSCNSFDGIAVDDILISNASPNSANFNTTCISYNTLKFTNLSGMCPTSFQWDFNDPISGANNTSSLTNPTHTFSNPGTYNVSLTVSGPCNAPSTITIPVYILGGGTNIQGPLCHGINNGYITLGIFGGNVPNTYLWSTGQTTASITGLGPGTYSVTVSSGNSCPLTTSYTLTDPQQIIPTIVTLNNVSCFGGNNGSAVITSIGGTGASTYTWSPGGFSGSTPTQLSAGTYTITTTDGYGCTAIDSITITQPSQLTVNTVSTNANCGNSNGSAIATGSGGTSPYTYKWLPNNLIAASINGLASGNYSVTVTDANSCTANNNLTITNTSGVTATISSTAISCNGYNNGTATISAVTGVSPYTYQWNNLQTTQTISSLLAGNYCGIITDANGCTDTLCTTLTAPPPIQVIANGTNLCSGQSGTLTANGIGGTSPFTYSWNAGSFTGQVISINPSSSATYSVIAIDANGCSSLSDTAIVNVLAPLSVSALSVAPICSGSSATLTAVASGGNGNYSFNWNPGNISGNNISVTPSSNTTYSVTLSDGCTISSAQATTSVNLIPSPDVNFTSDFSPACAPSCINFTDQTTSSSPILTWQWNFGDAQSSTLQSPRHCYASGGTYSVSLIATSVSGCIDSVIQNNYITLYNVPTASFIADPYEANLYEPDIHFFDQSADAASWLWNFGDGNSSTEQNPTHTFTEQNTFPVVLIVTSPFGCIDSATIDVNIKNDFTFYAPNAFTPNANGNNDTFLPRGTYWDPAKFNLHIFDRWGNLIFVSTDVNQGWDGNVKGGSKLVESDVYVWTVEISDQSGEKHYYTGSVTVVK